MDPGVPLSLCAVSEITLFRSLASCFLSLFVLCLLSQVLNGINIDYYIAYNILNIKYIKRTQIM